MNQYYILINNSAIGPMDTHQLMAYNPDANTPISVDGVNFQPLYAYPELMSYLQQATGAQGFQKKDSQRLAFGLLSILIGGLGIQYFMIGKTSAGIFNILLSFVTCGLWCIINFIQGILVLCMSDADFERKYVNTPASFPIF